MILRSLQIRLDYKKLNAESRKIFSFYLLMSIVPPAFVVVHQNPIAFDSFDHYLFVVIFLYHSIHIALFQVFIFVNGVQNRLRIISWALNELRSKRGDILCDLHNLKALLVELFETNKKVSKLFCFPLLISLVQISACLSINTYWATLALLGFSDASVIGEAFSSY